MQACANGEGQARLQLWYGPRMPRHVWLLSALLAIPLATACGERPTTTPSRPAANETTHEATSPATPPEAAPQVPSQPPPAIGLRAEVDATGVTLVLEQRDDARVKLKTAITIEREDSAGFGPLPDAALALRDACEREPGPCIELVPGAELRPPPWPMGGVQCTAKGAALAAGRYRFVAHACDGSYRVEGTPFTVNPTP